MGLSSIFVRNSAFFLYVIAKWSDDSAHDKGRRAFALRPNRFLAYSAMVQYSKFGWPLALRVKPFTHSETSAVAT